MRTTIVIDHSMEDRLRSLASRKELSSFINQCLREHFLKEERHRFQSKLEKAYQRAAKKGRVSEEFEKTEIEDWPEW